MTGEMSIRRSDQHGRAEHGWLNIHQSFTFTYDSDPQHMGFGNLPVIKECTGFRRQRRHPSNRG